MTFGQQVFSSFLGTVFGFIFAIVLFLITEAVKASLAKKNLRKNLKREFAYDISLLQEWVGDIDKILRKITADDQNVFYFLRYTFFQRHFIQEAFRCGLLYNLLTDEDISNLNTALVHCDVGGEQLANGNVQLWKTGQLPLKEALGIFEFEKECLLKYQKHFRNVLEKLN